jgi:hypothetical protein
VGAEVAVGPRPVPLQAELLGQGEHDRHGQHVVAARDLDQRLAVLGPDVGRVDDGEPPGPQAPLGDEVQDVERILGRGLVVRIVRHEAAEIVRREHLRRQEVPGRERRLAGARGPDKDDERQLGEGELHRANTAICVGGPTSGSSSPTGRKRTE